MKLKRLKAAGLLTAVVLSSLTLVAAPESGSARSIALAGNAVVSVNVNFQTQIPVADVSADGVIKSQESARKMLYELANKECALLKEAIANTCRVTNLNVNAKLNYPSNQNPPFLYINSNARYAITLKDGTEQQ